MNDKPKRRREEEWERVPLPPKVAARKTRRTHTLIGLVPLDEMTQDETDWLFQQKVRLAGGTWQGG
jgi:hypothetical protein